MMVHGVTVQIMTVLLMIVHAVTVQQSIFASLFGSSDWVVA
jgi:hypothetical protein